MGRRTLACAGRAGVQACGATARSRVRQEDAARRSVNPRRSEARGGREIDELVAHRVEGQLCVVVELHLFEQARAVDAHRLHGERERVRDVGEALARGEHAQRLVFAVGELFVRQLLGVDQHVIGERLGHRRAHILAAARDLLDRGRHLRGVHGLGQIARRAGLQRAHRVLILAIHREHQHRHARRLFLRAFEHLDAAHVGQRDVEQDHVAGVARERDERLAAGLGFDHFAGDAAVEQQLAHALAHHGVIVDEQDAQGHERAS
ncbi:hypothetical protein PT2222_10230 [Paraburkholderia tropica]